MSGLTVWQWQMVYIAHGGTDQVESPLAEFCLGPHGEVRIGTAVDSVPYRNSCFLYAMNSSSQN